MKVYLSIAALCFATACGGGGGSTSQVTVNNDPTQAGAGAVQASNSPVAASPSVAVTQTPSQIFETMINSVRADNGAGSLDYNAKLGVAAQRHAEDLATNEIWSHTGSDGSTIGQRVTDAGYAYRLVGENIARGQTDEQAALTAWMNSTTGHRENNLDVRFEDFALAKVDGRVGR